MQFNLDISIYVFSMLYDLAIFGYCKPVKKIKPVYFYNETLYLNQQTNFLSTVHYFTMRWKPFWKLASLLPIRAWVFSKYFFDLIILLNINNFSWIFHENAETHAIIDHSIFFFNLLFKDVLWLLCIKQPNSSIWA